MAANGPHSTRGESFVAAEVGVGDATPEGSGSAVAAGVDDVVSEDSAVMAGVGVGDTSSGGTTSIVP